MLTLLFLTTVICLIAVVYPYVIYPALLSRMPKRPIDRSAVDAGAAGDGGKFSLLFCAYNEAAALPAKIANLKELKERYPSLEVLAFDDGSRDGTAEIISREAPFVRLVRGGGRNGKAHGMKLLASLSRGTYLVFTDANVQLHLNALDNLAACYTDRNVGGVCGALHYMGAEGSVTAAVGSLYWRLEEKIKDLESSTGSVMGADGSIFSIRRELYPNFPDTVLDDFTVSMEAVFSGHRLIKSNDVIAYEHLVSARSDEFSRKIRIAARAWHTHSFLKDKRRLLSKTDKFKYLSHKTLRWFGGALLLSALLTGVSTLTLVHPIVGLAAVAVVILAVFLGLRMSCNPLSSVIEIALAMIATLLGVTAAMRGKTFQVWTPAKSRDATRGSNQREEVLPQQSEAQ